MEPIISFVLRFFLLVPLTQNQGQKVHLFYFIIGRDRFIEYSILNNVDVPFVMHNPFWRKRSRTTIFLSHLV
jgi:hypothetical protein